MSIPVVLGALRHMLNRLASFALLALLIAPRLESQLSFPAWHGRDGALPPMITTRAEVETLVRNAIEIANKLEATDTVFQGQPMISVMATTIDGRSTSSTVPAAEGLDTLHRYLGASTALSNLYLNYGDARAYRERAGMLNRARVSSISFVLMASTVKRDNSYRVEGHDSARVNAIADSIEAFARRSATWRGPEGGEMAKTGLMVVALLLLPIALALRDRKRIWLLYPASAALFVASYLFPYATVFNNLVISASR